MIEQAKYNQFYLLLTDKGVITEKYKKANAVVIPVFTSRFRANDYVDWLKETKPKKAKKIKIEQIPTIDHFERLFIGVKTVDYFGVDIAPGKDFKLIKFEDIIPKVD